MIKEMIETIEEKITIRRMLSDVSLSPGLDLSKMRISKVRAIRDDALIDIFDRIYGSFQGRVFPRLEGKGITINGRFEYLDKKNCGCASSAPLGMLIDPLYLGKKRNRSDYPHSPYYVRFNTEFCMDIPPERNYTRLDELMDSYVSEVDPDFIKEVRASPFREWKAMSKRSALA